VAGRRRKVGSDEGWGGAEIRGISSSCMRFWFDFLDSAARHAGEVGVNLLESRR
jgi:hypothetical protein